MAEDAQELARQARHFHQLFFPREALAPAVVERYAAANAVCFPRLDERSVALVTRVVARRLDAEAIELVLRRRGLDSTLSKKIQILFYLVEARASYYPYFINRKSHLWRAALALAGSPPRTAWKFVKGVYLIRRHHLV